MNGSLLVIETATAACSVALLRDEAVVAERHEIVGRGHAERLVPMIGELLGDVRPAAILVDCGPGSFTGLRVGLAAAQGLAIGWGVPVSGFSSLALLAAMSGERVAAAALHGGHGELFVQDFAGDPLAPLGSLRSLPPEEAATAVAAELVIGPAAGLLVAVRGFGRAVDTLPRAADARLLPEALRTLPARPIYGRAPDARPMP
ncbi:tRNA (adenosine(37)-N6)-threonylcarbamoyltransferase complex dimerization subunit type 1 TsaB [Sphingosinicella sp.]|uniref:tRNA (adenosine(37)-N6)-threonylcarbamoyltransferase complex dimerization subunit type 1 TsaB n=1 Tax=Sphingosinicella sp. TaxID=1917971 RepID=UPI0040382F2A